MDLKLRMFQEQRQKKKKRVSGFFVLSSFPRFSNLPGANATTTNSQTLKCKVQDKGRYWNSHTPYYRLSNICCLQKCLQLRFPSKSRGAEISNTMMGDILTKLPNLDLSIKFTKINYKSGIYINLLRNY